MYELEKRAEALKTYRMVAGDILENVNSIKGLLVIMTKDDQDDEPVVYYNRTTATLSEAFGMLEFTKQALIEDNFRGTES